MPEPTTPPPVETPPAQEPETIEGEEALGDPGKRALEAIRTERNAAKATAADLAKKLADYEKAEADKTEESKSEAQKREEAHTALATRAEKAEHALLRLEVAQEHGLTAAQAKRLVGTTKEELEADAAEIAELFAPATPTPNARPKARLRGGSAPNEEPDVTDPKKLAADIRR